jgi:hypothetical protein
VSPRHTFFWSEALTYLGGALARHGFTIQQLSEGNYAVRWEGQPAQVPVTFLCCSPDGGEDDEDAEYTLALSIGGSEGVMTNTYSEDYSDPDVPAFMDVVVAVVADLCALRGVCAAARGQGWFQRLTRWIW